MSKHLDDANCSLKLHMLVFDLISFTRNGFKNDKELKLSANIQVSENDSIERKRVSLTFSGKKDDEYTFEIKLSGFFSVENESKELEDTLLRQNAVAILMPYMRSQLSLLTAQPETEPIVLPPFNIVEMLNSSKKQQV